MYNHRHNLDLDAMIEQATTPGRRRPPSSSFLIQPPSAMGQPNQPPTRKTCAPITTILWGKITFPRNRSSVQFAIPSKPRSRGRRRKLAILFHLITLSIEISVPITPTSRLNSRSKSKGKCWVIVADAQPNLLVKAFRFVRSSLVLSKRAEKGEIT